MATAKVKAIETEHSTEWHWDKFAEFCRFKALVKEPSPHMQMLGELSKGSSKEDVIWLCGLYAAFYNIPSALVMWKEWPWERAPKNRKEIKPWLEEHWSGTFTRVERRAVRTVKNMHECIDSYITWAKDIYPTYLELDWENEAAYDFVWQNTDKNLKFMGRYIIIRLLEALHRFAGLKPYLYDIRSIGGWSPKRALGLLYPEHLELLLSPDTKENVAKVDKLAYGAMDKFRDEYNTPMSPYVFAAMLCEYRVAYEKRHQYPGWTIDQEPAYWSKIESYWQKVRGPLWASQVADKFYNVRKQLFPNENLGEIYGWEGTRVEPRSTLRDHGYNWLDSKYDYNKTTDFSKPVLR